MYGCKRLKRAQGTIYRVPLAWFRQDGSEELSGFSEVYKASGNEIDDA